MKGREFLGPARRHLAGGTEADWRTATGRAYYALMLESRDALERWGAAPPPKMSVHSFVRLKLTYASNKALQDVGKALDDLVRARNEADYDTQSVGRFFDANSAQTAIDQADKAIALLDAIETDPLWRANVIASLPARP